jgi:thioredoxin 1
MNLVLNVKSVVFFSLVCLSTLSFKDKPLRTFDDQDSGLSVEEFYKKVNIKDRIVLVYFHADWCVPCIKLKPAIQQITEEEKATVMVLSLDVDKNPAVSTHFEINTLPLFMIFKNGKKVWENNTALSKVELVKKLDLYRKSTNEQ